MVASSKAFSSSGLSQPVARPRQPTIASPSTHTMGNSLREYLRIKIHPDIADRDWSSILVKGSHLRSMPGRVSSIEKTDKPFNWQRPTTSLDGDQRLVLHVFPGREYVYHYASLVATYLSLQGKNPGVVSYLEPRPEECMSPLLSSNLAHLGPVDVVVVGYVHGLTGLTGPGPWEYGDSKDELFSWKISSLPNGTRVAFLGCRICFWGDIAGNLVRALQQLCQVKCVFYIGKLGSLRPEHAPNRVIATGNTTTVYGANIKWDNPLLTHILDSDPCILQGRHATLPSVMDETHQWFEDHSRSSDWVEPEIGHMALASLSGATDFGYMHIVSDNLAKKYLYDLSNERIRQVVEDRKLLVARIEAVLDSYLRNRS